MTQTANRFPKVALQICCFPNGPESRGGVTLAGAQLMTFSAAYSHEGNGRKSGQLSKTPFGTETMC